MVGVWVQIGTVCTLVSGLFVAGMWMATSPALSILRFDDDLCTNAGVFASWSVIRILPMNLFVVVNNALQVRVVPH